MVSKSRPGRYREDKMVNPARNRNPAFQTAVRETYQNTYSKYVYSKWNMRHTSEMDIVVPRLREIQKMNRITQN